MFICGFYTLPFKLNFGDEFRQDPFNSKTHLTLEMKINSDSESEVPFSDEDGEIRNAIRENSNSKNDFAVQCPSENPLEMSSVKTHLTARNRTSI
ncbi:hypothetical protein L484_005747 [Morus notabilis]|uniref:Uncharacterized protein n=1 Tax=Morus notabilis TaxID=981085 RepID=W9RBY5_9ROSA|nr:hypothetical protein L484_005747 [Morus notabilis]